jgi:hypothetical protein
MAYERPAGVGQGPEPLPTSTAAAAQSGVEPSVAVRLQILSTEHWSLLGSRSLAWNESFSRAGMFLSTVTGAIVALALVAQASEFGQGFRSSRSSSCRSSSSSASGPCFASTSRTTTTPCA